MSELTKLKLQWVIDSFYGYFILKLLRYVFSLDYHIYIIVQVERPYKSSLHGSEYSGNVLRWQ